MDIRNIRELKNTAFQRLAEARDGKKILLTYSLISVLSALLVTVINYCLGMQVNQLGGLGNMGIKSILTTITSVLPMVLNLALMCLELGFIAAMIRIGRGMYTSVQTLRAGMPRFWVMLRANLLLYAILFAMTVGAFYLATLIFALLPASNALMELMLPLVTAVDPAAAVLEAGLDAQMMEALIPLGIIFMLTSLVMVLPVSYQYRMTNYVLLHNPRAGARYALRESSKMMRRNRLALFKIDLSLWWFYGVSILASIVCYGDWVLEMFGISLPIPEWAGYFLFYVLFLGITFASNMLLKGKAGVVYAMFFDAVRPKEEENTNGVVLGNIFQM